MRLKERNKKILLSVIFFLTISSDSCTEASPRRHISNSKIIPAEVAFYEEVLPSLSGKTVILVTNPSGIGRYPERILREFKEKKVKIKHLIGLEHGFLGLEEDFSKSPVTMDETFQLPIYHIYKVKNSEIPAILKGADAIVFDVLDMGMRCYTYLSVLKRLMDSLPDPQTTRFVILDHPNPALYLGARGEGIQKKFLNFAGEFPSLFFTGMTIGEAAMFYNGEYLSDKVKLEIISPKNLKRGVDWEKEGIVWTTPSPNLPMLDSARNYLGLVMLEGINVSVGRGTQAPFIYFGAPWMGEPDAIVNELNDSSKEDYYYQSVFFKPTFGPFKGEICRGLRLTVVNKNYDPIRMAYVLIATLKKHYKDFRWRQYPDNTYNIDYLWGTEHFRQSIDSNVSYEEFKRSYSEAEESANRIVRKYRLY
ncbi:PF07075 family protein [Leptospira inadai serovar Lyme str. 10]|uniref:PF07075 family protein n=2 Tax=Leptospira inadai serovar Lyme TaxID=293084 RepID=V6HBN8_9LEPT|nr:DUF1343 domain-containing protein [Leptospira inadai]EQA37116.1 PF07075 family protein [Leptospira inadai serovar Lyme str. 10]PNV76531.1 DUF1343 domain-containing protein [Leptospira inadai serovar Lyme]